MQTAAQTLAQTLELVLINLDDTARATLIGNTRMYVDDLQCETVDADLALPCLHHAQECLMLLQQLNADM